MKRQTWTQKGYESVFADESQFYLQQQDDLNLHHAQYTLPVYTDVIILVHHME